MASLLACLSARGGLENFEDPGEGDEEASKLTFTERRRYSYHRRIDRDSKAAKAAKKIHGFNCMVCDFDFESIYGVLGSEYIEAHHLTPLSELPEDIPVEQDPETDFAVLCANCHRMMHRKGSPKTVEGLRAILNASKGTK